MKIVSRPRVITAGVLGFFLLAFVHEFSLGDCYYIGSFTTVDTFCAPAFLYYGAWLIVIGLGWSGVFGWPKADESEKS